MPSPETQVVHCTHVLAVILPASDLSPQGVWSNFGSLVKKVESQVLLYCFENFIEIDIAMAFLENKLHLCFLRYTHTNTINKIWASKKYYLNFFSAGIFFISQSSF